MSLRACKGHAKDEGRVGSLGKLWNLYWPLKGEGQYSPAGDIRVGLEALRERFVGAKCSVNVSHLRCHESSNETPLTFQSPA